MNLQFNFLFLRLFSQKIEIECNTRYFGRKTKEPAKMFVIPVFIIHFCRL